MRIDHAHHENQPCDRLRGNCCRFRFSRLNAHPIWLSGTDECFGPRTMFAGTTNRTAACTIYAGCVLGSDLQLTSTVDTMLIAYGFQAMTIYYFAHSLPSESYVVHARMCARINFAVNVSILFVLNVDI